MSSPALPDFEHTLQLSQGNLDAADLAECHGALCGMLCGEPGKTASDFLELLSALKLLVEPGAGLVSSMTEVFHCTQEQLQDEELGFTLWLPDDEQPLEERTVALAQWCTGFLAAMGGGAQLADLSEESSEALKDLGEIAGATVDGGSVEGGEYVTDDPDEEETAFMEIVEYVRVVTLLMREEFRGPDQHDLIH
jgi:uncharacterized protein YgfB (UPF0149 family)